MGRIRFAALLTLISLCLMSCGGISFSDYRGEDFIATVEYYCGGERILSGEVEYSKAGGEDESTMRVVLSYPEALSGVVLLKERGRTTVRLGDREMESEAFSYIMGAVELLIPSGDALRVEKRRISGGAYTVAMFSGGVEVYFDLRSEFPTEVRCGEERLIIRKFEMRD